MNQLRLKIALEAKGLRLDQWLATVPEVGTRNQGVKLIEKGLIKVSGVAPLKVKASYRLLGNEEIEINIPAPVASLITPQDIAIEILYQDSDIAVVNKPAGLVTHPAAGHGDGTLVNALLFHIKDLSDIGGVERPGLVHRLDKDTSGVLVVAKTNRAHQRLSEAFKNHDIHRVYWALVAGIPKIAEQTVVSHLARHPMHRKAFSSQETGKLAITHYVLEKSYKNQASFLKVTLKTGRTHQIRVHLSEQGNPVIGDLLYGVKKQKAWLTSPKLKKFAAGGIRQALHAAELGFDHPITGQKLLFNADWPADMKPLLEALSTLT